MPRLSPELTEIARADKNGKPRWPGVEVWKGERVAGGHYGFALEVVAANDEEVAATFADEACALSPELDEWKERAAVAMIGTTGRRVRLQWGEHAGAIDVWADGKPSPFNDPKLAFVYRGDLLEQAWQGRALVVTRSEGKEPWTFSFPDTGKP